METPVACTDAPPGSQESGGQNAERQWRHHRPLARLRPRRRARGPKRRKAMETPPSPIRPHPQIPQPEPGGQNAERQWRPGQTILDRFVRRSQGAKTPKGNGDILSTPLSVGRITRARGPKRRKAMETPVIVDGLVFHHHEPGGQNAERQWRLEEQG